MFICLDQWANERLRATVNSDTQEPAFYIKLNKLLLTLKTLSFQFEGEISRKSSVSLGLRITPNRGIPTQMITEIFPNAFNPEVKNYINATKFYGFAVTPEYRFYIRQAGKGFYAAPFIRYEQFEYKTDVEIKPTGLIYNLHFDGRIRRLGSGLMVGIQYQLTKNVFLDWWIAGAYMGLTRINVLCNGYKIEDQDFDQYVAYVNKMGTLVRLSNPQNEIASTYARFNSSAFVPDFRTGLALAIRF